MVVLFRSRCISAVSDYFTLLSVYKGLKYNDILKEIQELRTEIKIVKTIDNYGIFLLEQIYSDLDFEKRDKNKSKNLIELKNEFQKISKKNNHSL